jgi:RNA 3'-phosphate cyclase
MLCIDGSYGEGGGQIIRTSLALSLITGKPFRVRNVRARRDKPGLQRQHLTAVTAAAAIGTAKADGAHLGSKEFTFEPGAIQPGEYKFTIGTAGSTMLVLQAVLPPLMIADAPSLLLFEGGTHNVKAPPFEFIRKSFLPLINRTGPNVTVELQRYGFYRAAVVSTSTSSPPRSFVVSTSSSAEPFSRNARAPSASNCPCTSASASWPSRASSLASCPTNSTSKSPTMP